MFLAESRSIHNPGLRLGGYEQSLVETAMYELACFNDMNTPRLNPSQVTNLLLGGGCTGAALSTTQ